ncbi:MAG: hypothetical protein AB7O43_09185 [Hyphomicrobiaceae bacterium]
MPDIPVVYTGADFPMATLISEEARAHALIDCATRLVPRGALRGLDAVSRRWLVKRNNAYLPEIDAIAARLGRPGAYFLAVNYEWGCTVGLGPSPDRRGARLARTLDWVTEGLGRYVIAAHVSGPAGAFVALTWPGFTGVLQGLAPGRFSAALNQAPMRRLGGGFYPLDWAANRLRVWRMPHPMPAHLLRQVFETAGDYAEAKRMLTTAAIAAPAIFMLAGIEPDQTCRIERTEEEARVSDGIVCASNHWQSAGWEGRPRGFDSPGRLAAMGKVDAIELDPSFGWLVPPLLNPLTRLAMVSDAREGRFIARGFEKGEPATSVLHWR